MIVSSSKHLFAIALVGGLLMLSAGCQALSWKKDLGNPLAKFGEEQATVIAPDRMVATWSEAVLHKAGTGTRGFGGRIYFYDRTAAEPQEVEGQLVVYAFQEDNPEVSQDKYTKRYVFPPEQFARHKSESEIGVSYSVWLPWDEVGGDQAEVSLIARFEPLKGGGLVVSDQARQRLPGKPKLPATLAKPSQPKPTSEAMNDQLVEQAGYRTSVEMRDIEPSEEAPRQLTATTISLPSRFRGRPQQASSPSTANRQAVGTPESQQAVPAPTPIRTSVEYLTPGESVRRSVQRQSIGSSR